MRFNELLVRLVGNPVVHKSDLVRGMAEDVFISHSYQKRGGGEVCFPKQDPYVVSPVRRLIKF